MRKVVKMGLCAAALAAEVALLAGCSKDDVEEARKRMASGQQPPASGQPATPAPGGGAPMGGAGMGGAPMMGSDGPNDGNAIPLKSTGNNSAAELKRELTKLSDKAAAERFESAFRLTFSSDMTKRDYRHAQELLNGLIQSQPKFAPAHRTLGYAEFNLNPADTGTALAEYDKAVEIDPNYAEAHYAIAFMCAATGDRDKGVSHYRKAMALGMADERNIGERFYGDLLKPQ